MEVLPTALSYVRSALDFDASGQKIQAVINYKIAVDYLKVSVTNSCPEDKKVELADQLNFYQQRVQELERELSMMTIRKPKVESAKVKVEEQELSIKTAENCHTNEEFSFRIEKPTTNFADVCGLDEVKSVLEQAVVLPVKHPEIFKSAKPYKGFLLFGPPGTGKSYLAKAAAGEASSSTFFTVSASDVLSKWQGESEKLIKNLFETAKQKSPSIIFIGELDSLAMTRNDSDNDSSRRIKTELFLQIDRATSDPGVFIMGATNTPQNLDDAILRRFDKLLYISLPDEAARTALFYKELQAVDQETEITEDVVRELGRRTDGFSGSDISRICRSIKMQPIQRLQQTTHFRPVVAKNGQTVFTPCSKGDRGAKKMRLTDIPAGQVMHIGATTQEDAYLCVAQAKPVVDSLAIQKMEKFAREKGETVTTKPEMPKKKRSRSSKVFDAIWNFL